MIPDELNQHGAVLNPPATDAQLQELESALDCSLPSELRALYLQHDGMQDPGDFPFRLMSTEDVVETHRAMREEGLVPEEIRFFWTDDQSNYAALYVSGPASGRVCVVDHEEPDTTPLFRSVTSFYRALGAAAENGQDWYELLQQPGGPETEGTPEEQAADLALAEDYFQRYAGTEDPRQRQAFAFAGMQLLPPSETSRLLDWLRSEDMWIQERACTLLGRRGYAEAIPALAEVARTGKHNGRVAALTALRKFGAPAQEEVTRLRNELEPQWHIYLGKP